jgi:hypothetical protein
MIFDPPLAKEQLKDLRYEIGENKEIRIGDVIRMRRKTMFVAQPSRQRWLLLSLRIKHRRPMSDKDWWEYYAGPQGSISWGLGEPPPSMHTRIA